MGANDGAQIYETGLRAFLTERVRLTEAEVADLMAVRPMTGEVDGYEAGFRAFCRDRVRLTEAETDALVAARPQGATEDQGAYVAELVKAGRLLGYEEGDFAELLRARETPTPAAPRNDVPGTTLTRAEEVSLATLADPDGRLGLVDRTRRLHAVEDSLVRLREEATEAYRTGGLPAAEKKLREIGADVRQAMAQAGATRDRVTAPRGAGMGQEQVREAPQALPVEDRVGTTQETHFRRLLGELVERGLDLQTGARYSSMLNRLARRGEFSEEQAKALVEATVADREKALAALELANPV